MVSRFDQRSSRVRAAKEPEKRTGKENKDKLTCSHLLLMLERCLLTWMQVLHGMRGRLTRVSRLYLLRSLGNTMLKLAWVWWECGGHHHVSGDRS